MYHTYSRIHKVAIIDESKLRINTEVFYFPTKSQPGFRYLVVEDPSVVVVRTIDTI